MPLFHTNALTAVVEHSIFIVEQIKCSWLIPHEQAICFSSLIWLSRNKSVKKSRFSRMVKNSREFSLLDLDLEAFWFHFSLLEKEWKHFDFTLHFSKKSESIFFSLCTSRKRVKAFCFHFSLPELQKPTLTGPCIVNLFFIPLVMIQPNTLEVQMLKINTSIRT